MARLLTLFAILVTLALPARAQERATLVSDSLQITGDTRLIAEASVGPLLARIVAGMAPRAD